MDVEVLLRGYGKPFVVLSDAYQECVARTLKVDAKMVGQAAINYKQYIETEFSVKDVFDGKNVPMSFAKFVVATRTKKKKKK